jgi:hypothetical protein
MSRNWHIYHFICVNLMLIVIQLSVLIASHRSTTYYTSRAVMNTVIYTSVVTSRLYCDPYARWHIVTSNTLCFSGIMRWDDDASSGGAPRCASAGRILSNRKSGVQGKVSQKCVCTRVASLAPFLHCLALNRKYSEITRKECSCN